MGTKSNAVYSFQLQIWTMFLPLDIQSYVALYLLLKNNNNKNPSARSQWEVSKSHPNTMSLLLKQTQVFLLRINIESNYKNVYNF